MDMWRSRSALSLSQFTSERRHRKTRVWFGPVSGVIGGSLAWSAQSKFVDPDQRVFYIKKCQISYMADPSVRRKMSGARR